ncbi:hypothetical protein ACJMK2_037702 [Sinanodonta woodiana]|uniref:Uncharacterized protein n=1 Tax=Sinanodonta woodiana TaxID=1069815 RepID=A0ABD3WLA3_SINWO
MTEKSKVLTFTPRYVDTLDPICKSGYMDKIRLIDNKDPYEIPKAECLVVHNSVTPALLSLALGYAHQYVPKSLDKKYLFGVVRIT